MSKITNNEELMAFIERDKSLREFINNAEEDGYLEEDESEQTNLNAKYGHYCHEWDLAWITENDPEFEVCMCFSNREMHTNYTSG